MKKIIYFLLITYSVLYSSQTNLCSYVNNPPGANYRDFYKDPSIFAVDFTIPASTIISLQSAEFDVMFKSHGDINQAVIYIYEDNNEQPGALINSYPLSVTSTLISNTNTFEWRKVNISLQTLTPLTSSNMPRKVWFGFKLTIPDDGHWWNGDYKKMCLSSDLMTDGTPIKYFNTSTNLWKIYRE